MSSRLCVRCAHGYGHPRKNRAATLVPGWIQARQGRLVLATGFVEYCGCPVGLLRAAKKPKRLYFLYIILVSSKKKVFVGKMSPGCTSGPFPSRLSPFLFFPDHPRSLGVPNFHQGAPLKNPFLPPLPLRCEPPTVYFAANDGARFDALNICRTARRVATAIDWNSQKVYRCEDLLTTVCIKPTRYTSAEQAAVL